MKTEEKKIKKEKQLKKFIRNSSGEMVELFQLKSDFPELQTEIEKIIRNQRRINTMIFSEWFGLKELN